MNTLPKAIVMNDMPLDVLSLKFIVSILAANEICNRDFFPEEVHSSARDKPFRGVARILPEYTNTGALLISLCGSFELPQGIEKPKHPICIQYFKGCQLIIFANTWIVTLVSFEI